MATRLQQRRGTAAQWATDNPILAAGEIGYETDTKVIKVGNGVSTWSSLTNLYDLPRGRYTRQFMFGGS